MYAAFFMPCFGLYVSKIFYIMIIWYICSAKYIDMAKVIHVHLTHGIDGTKRRDWYFSSISAVYTVLTAEQVEQITAQNMETAWNVARQGGYEDVSLLATQEFEQIFVLKK